jgi:hypothetical protein
MTTTNNQNDQVLDDCKQIFLKKNRDYGTAWRVLRTISIVDQIFIKAQRIRNIQEIKTQKVDDDLAAEFKGIINYAIIGMMQLELSANDPEEMPEEKVSALFTKFVTSAKALMQDKNHDYGEA